MSLYRKQRKLLLILILFMFGLVVLSGTFVMSMHSVSAVNSDAALPMNTVSFLHAANVTNSSSNNSTNPITWINTVLHRVLEFTVGAVLTIAIIIGLWLAIPVMFGSSDQKVSALDRLKHWAIGLIIVILLSSGTLIALVRGFLGT